MCGRYGLEAHYGTSLGGVPLTESFTSWNIAPTQQAPILLNRRVTRTAQRQLPDAPRRPGVHRLGVSTLDTSGTYREIYRARWGLIPDWHPWDEDPKPPALTFNARSETLFEKASYARPAVTGHCAIPTSGYYEWGVQGSTITARGTVKEHKIPQRIGPPGQYLYLAGLYAWHKINPVSAKALTGGGYEPQTGQWLLTFTILTMASPRSYTGQDGSPLLRELGHIHERMPLPLNPAAVNGQPSTLDVWLGSGRVAGTPKDSRMPTMGVSDLHDARTALEQLQHAAYPQAAQWRVQQVSSRIGNIKNNDKSVLEPDTNLLTLLDSDTYAEHTTNPEGAHALGTD